MMSTQAQCLHAPSLAQFGTCSPSYAKKQADSHPTQTEPRVRISRTRGFLMRKFRLASLGNKALSRLLKNEGALPPCPPLRDTLRTRIRCALAHTYSLARPKHSGKDPDALTSLAGYTTLSAYIFFRSYGILKRRGVRFTPSERVSIYVRVKRADVNSEFSRRA